MKKFTSRLRSLAAIWLVAVMLVTMFAFGVSAENINTLAFYIGDQTITKDTDINSFHDNDVLITAVDFDKPLNQDDAITDMIEGSGGDLVGWTVWRNANSGQLAEKSMDLAADVTLSTITEQQLQEAFDTSNTVDWSELLFVPKIDLKYWFTRKPTASYPAVDTNKPADSYQWCKPEYADFEVVGESVDNLAPNQTFIDYCFDGSYNEETGVWEGEYASNDSYILDASVTMNPGDVLTITVSDGFDGTVVEYLDNDVFTKNGNVYTYTHTNNLPPYFNFYICKSTVAFTATITLNQVAEFVPVEGQTDKVYTGEGVALCKASFENGKYVISSNTVSLGNYYITQQPSTEDPTVKVNNPADVKGYQWYSVKDITGKYIISPDDNEAGLKIKVTGISTAEEMEDFTGQINGPEDLLASGVNIALGEYKGEGVWAPVLPDPNDPTITELSSVMILDALSGGKLTVDIQVSDELQATIDSDDDISLEDIYELVILPFDTETINGNVGPTPLFPDANGVYTVPEDADFVVIVLFTVTEGITFKPVYDTTLSELTAVDGQTKATFDGDEGKYLVKVTMKDDTVFTSDAVITKNIVDVPEDIVKTGDTTPYALWLTIFALSGVAFVFSASKLRKA